MACTVRIAVQGAIAVHTSQPAPGTQHVTLSWNQSSRTLAPPGQHNTTSAASGLEAASAVLKLTAVLHIEQAPKAPKAAKQVNKGCQKQVTPLQQ